MALLLALLVLGQGDTWAPVCPHDAKVTALGGAELEGVGRAMRAQPEVKRWITDRAEGCKVEFTPRLVRTLEGLSQRCTSALVELELRAHDCREVTVRPGGVPLRAFAIVSADGRGRLRPVQTFLGVEPPFPVQAPLEVTRVECGGSLLNAEAGLAEVRSVVSEPSLRFDGCVLRGVSVETVRREVLGCLEHERASDVTVRFFSSAASPACVVTTRLVEGKQRAVVVRSGGLVPGGVFVDDPPRFKSSAAYLELAGPRPVWLCADLGLEQPNASCAPSCVPPMGKSALLESAVQAGCGWTQSVVERHEVALGSLDAGAGSGIHVEKIVLESGHAIPSEAVLAERIRTSVASLASCAGKLAPYDGALGALVFSSSGAVAMTALAQRDGTPLDDECARASVVMPLRAFTAKVGRNAGVAIYRFRLTVSP